MGRGGWRWRNGKISEKRGKLLRSNDIFRTATRHLRDIYIIII